MTLTAGRDAERSRGAGVDLWALAEHPEWPRRQREVDHASRAGDPPAPTGRLPYTEAVVAEVMRRAPAVAAVVSPRGEAADRLPSGRRVTARRRRC